MQRDTPEQIDPAILRQMDVTWELYQRTTDFVALDPYLVEHLPAVRYTTPQAKYKVHHDHGAYYGKDTELWAYTMLVFLNIPSNKGQTASTCCFLEADVPTQDHGCFQQGTQMVFRQGTQMVLHVVTLIFDEVLNLLVNNEASSDEIFLFIDQLSCEEVVVWSHGILQKMRIKRYCHEQLDVETGLLVSGASLICVVSGFPWLRNTTITANVTFDEINSWLTTPKMGLHVMTQAIITTIVACDCLMMRRPFLDTACSAAHESDARHHHIAKACCFGTRKWVWQIARLDHREDAIVTWRLSASNPGRNFGFLLPNAMPSSHFAQQQTRSKWTNHSSNDLLKDEFPCWLWTSCWQSVLATKDEVLIALSNPAIVVLMLAPSRDCCSRTWVRLQISVHVSRRQDRTIPSNALYYRFYVQWRS